MRTLYLECNMGAAGDMLLAALLELHDAPEDFLKRLNTVGIPGVTVTANPSVKCGIKGTHISVKVNGQEEHSYDKHGHTHTYGHHKDTQHHTHSPNHNNQHEHSHNHGHHDAAHSHGSNYYVQHLINHLNITEQVKQNAIGVYKMLAEAESHAHGVPVSQVHFHEVGEMDAVADIVGVCMLIEELSPDVILSSPVNVGSGHVRCSHGILPVPAPATAFILQNTLMYSDQTKGELCTPTGAALLKYFVSEFCSMPLISVKKHGYGMGTKDFDKVNCVRVFLGETGQTQERVAELVCNLDDMTSEALAFAQQQLMESGAFDVCITPTIMKKGRAGFSLTCMCSVSDIDKMRQLIFKHTTTLGIREYTSRRYTLCKEYTEVETRFGIVRLKTSYGYGVKKSKPEYEDIARIAKDRNISVQDVLHELNYYNIKYK